MKRLALGAVLIAAFAAFAAGVYFSRSASQLVEPPRPTQSAVGRLLATPVFDPAGKEITLAQWRDKPLIVNFWATWCPPCLSEMPLFSRLQEKYRGVQFIGIAIDTAENVQAFAGKNKFSYPLLLGSEAIMPLMSELGNGRDGLPFTVAIDAAGQVRHIRLGALSEAETEHLIATLQ